MKTKEQIKDELILLYEKQKEYNSYDRELKIIALKWVLDEKGA